MEDKIVGTKNCSIRDIWTILNRSVTLKQNWRDFAGSLQVPTEKIDIFQQDLLLKTINQGGIIMQSLHIWVAQEGSNAKLSELIRVIKDDCQDTDAAEKLQALFA